MAAEQGDHHSAHEVSDAFVKQYFHVLQNLPEEARKLYVDDSVVSRPGPDGAMLSFTSVEAIDEHILSCDYKRATFEVISVDAQNSFESGIMIMVIGFLIGKDNLKRKFSQSFYLARQNNIYVVLNDILRFVGNEASSLAESPIAESVNGMEKKASGLIQAEPVQKIENCADNSKNIEEIAPLVNEKIETSVDNSKNVEEISPLENGKIEKPIAKSEITESIVPKAQSDATKRSFAAIVQSMAQNASPFHMKASSQKPKAVTQPRAAAAPAPESVIKSEKKNDPKIIEEPGTSLFVANLPMSAMPAELYELFKGFGPIKDNGIQVRSSRSSGICFGFVAFDSASSVQSVLQAAKASPFMLGDRSLRVKEKQVEYEGSKPSGRNGGVSRAHSGDHRDNSNRNRRYGGRNERRGDHHRTIMNARGDVKATPEITSQN